MENFELLDLDVYCFNNAYDGLLELAGSTASFVNSVFEDQFNILETGKLEKCFTDDNGNQKCVWLNIPDGSDGNGKPNKPNAAGVSAKITF